MAAVSEYQYYEFLAVDRPLTADEQDEVRQFSSSAKITATSFASEYHWGDFRGDPGHLMRHYYDAHLYLANWGTHRIMLRLPRTALDPKIARRYCVADQVSVSQADEYLIIDMTSEDESGEEDAGEEEPLSAIVGVRTELATGDLRPLYLAWLSAYGTWERDEYAFEEDDEDEVEPPVPPGLQSLTAAQRALAGFLRLDQDLLEVAAQASPPLEAMRDDSMAAGIAGLPEREKDRLLLMVAQDQGARVKLELLRQVGGVPASASSERTVAELLDAAALARQGG